MTLIFSNFVQRAAIWLLGNTEGLSLWKRQMNRGAFRSFPGFWAFKQSQAKSKMSLIACVVEPGWWLCSHTLCPLLQSFREAPGLGLTPFISLCGRGKWSQVGCQRTVFPLCLCSQWGSGHAPGPATAQDFTGAVPPHPGARCGRRGRSPCECWCYLSMHPSGFPQRWHWSCRCSSCIRGVGPGWEASESSGIRFRCLQDLCVLLVSFLCNFLKRRLSFSKDILKHLLLFLCRRQVWSHLSSQPSLCLGNFFSFCDSLDFWLQKKPAVHPPEIFFKGELP